MLRRKRTKSKQRRPLGRSKSTSCIKPNRIVELHSDPVIGQRDAHIAARLSYQRAHNRTSDDMAGFSRESSSRGVGTDEGRVSRHDFARSESARSQVDETNCGHLSRQQSVRFTGPGSRHRRSLASRASESRLTPAPNAKLRTPHDSKIERRARSAVSDSRDFSFSSSALNPMRLMQSSESRLNSEDDVALALSADKRIRKSKSMFTTFNPADAGYDFSNSPAQPKEDSKGSRYASLNKENTPLAKSDIPGLRAPKSMSFLRSRRENTSSHASSYVDNDMTVQLAREKFREQVEGQSRLKSHPSMFFRSRNRRTDSSTGLRKSLRNSSNNSTALSSAFSGDSLAVPKQGSLRKTARKVSSSIKTTLKGIFGRRTSGTPSSMNRGASETQDADDESYLHIDQPASNEDASMSRGPSRTAMVYTVPSPHKMKSLRGSLDSYEAEDGVNDDKSRVTSWTDSVTNTVASHAATADWERQRLSVIKENGLHVSSSGPLSSMASQDYAIGKAITVDSQRVYSALMKRAHEAEKREEDERRRSVDKMRSLGRAPPRSSSVDQFECQSWSPPTIRCVQPEDDVFQDEARKVDSVDNGSPRSIVKHSRKNHHPGASASGSPNPWSKGGMDTSPGKASVSSRSDLDRVRTLTHRSSAFFASPSNHLFRTASPFRRALRESMQSEVVAEPAEAPREWDMEYLGSMSEISLPTRRPSPVKSDATERGGCAESIYSSMDEEVKADSSLVGKFPMPPNTESHGNATIFVSPPVRRSPRRQIRDVSTASSVEWKTWLSSHVSKLEGSNAETKTTPWSSPDMFPKLGHIREKAEIESSSENTPLRPMTGNPRSHAVQKHPTLSRHVAIGDENEAPLNDEHQTSVVVTKQQSSRGKNSFRATPSLPTLRDRPYGSPSVKSNPSVRQSASLSTLSQSTLARKDEVAQRRRARMRVVGDAASSAKSSPGLTAAVERQFGKTMTGSPAQTVLGARNIPSSPSNPWVERSIWDKTGVSYKEEVQTMDSKHMVDSFLNSRRQRIEGNESDIGSSPAAFV